MPTCIAFELFCVDNRSVLWFAHAARLGAREIRSLTTRKKDRNKKDKNPKWCTAIGMYNKRTKPKKKEREEKNPTPKTRSGASALNRVQGP
jgi:hypothetical protein